MTVAPHTFHYHFRPHYQWRQQHSRWWAITTRFCQLFRRTTSFFATNGIALWKATHRVPTILRRPKSVRYWPGIDTAIGARNVDIERRTERLPFRILPNSSPSAGGHYRTRPKNFIGTLPRVTWSGTARKYKSKMRAFEHPISTANPETTTHRHEEMD
jgi:hypothetical protein